MNILEARRRLLEGGVKKRTAEGNPIVVRSLARMYPGLNIYGWSKQDGTPSPDNPVPIVSAGTKNQENGKWEYEITITNAQTDPDKNQTVTLTADRPLTKWDRLEKRGGQWGWVYKSAEVVFDGSEKWSLYPTANVGTVFYTTLPNATIGFQTSLCDKYQNIDRVWDVIYDGVLGVYSDNAATKNKYFRPPSAAVETVEQFKSWLSENPLTVLFETSAETFVPLSSSEQDALNALHTYRPTTALSNQQGCQMALTYKTRKGVGGGNLLDFENITFIKCYPVSQYSIMCNIENGYMSSIDIYYLNDLISESKGKKLVFSFTGNPSGRRAAIVLYGTYSDGSIVKEANNYGDNPVELIIPDTLESASRLVVRVNRNTIPFTDTTTIISNLNLRLED